MLCGFVFQLNVTSEDLIAYNKSYERLRGDVSVYCSVVLIYILAGLFSCDADGNSSH